MAKEKWRIPVVKYDYEEAMAELRQRIDFGEKKYQMSSEQMLNLVSTRDDEWETLEILKWMSAYRAYQSLLAKVTLMDGTIGITTETSTNGD